MDLAQVILDGYAHGKKDGHELQGAINGQVQVDVGGDVAAEVRQSQVAKIAREPAKQATAERASGPCWAVNDLPNGTAENCGTADKGSSEAGDEGMVLRGLLINRRLLRDSANVHTAHSGQSDSIEPGDLFTVCHRFVCTLMHA